MRKKNFYFILSMLLICALFSCGKKGEPIPRGLPIPAGINDLSGEVKDGVLFLSFSLPSRNQDGTEITNLEGFKILKSCSSCMGVSELFKEIRLDEEKGFTVIEGKVYVYDDEVLDGFEYSYRVYPYTKNGTRGNLSNTYTVQWTKPPAPPVDVSAKPADGMVELSWQPQPGFFYNVYRYEDDTYPLFPENEKPLATAQFLDTGLENGTRYRYEVRTVQMKGAVRVEGEGSRIEATPADNVPPPPPYNLKAQKQGAAVKISWEIDAVEDILGYNVFRKVGNKREKLNVEPIKEEVFYDRSLPSSRYVSYFATALDMSGNESDPSSEFVVILKGD